MTTGFGPGSLFSDNPVHWFCREWSKYPSGTKVLKYRICLGPRWGRKYPSLVSKRSPRDSGLDGSQIVIVTIARRLARREVCSADSLECTKDVYDKVRRTRVEGRGEILCLIDGADVAKIYGTTKLAPKKSRFFQ
jgi:hypothetical protein